MKIITRRGLLGGIIAAPMIVRYDSLMPVPRVPKFYAELLFNGEPTGLVKEYSFGVIDYGPIWQSVVTNGVRIIDSRKRELDRAAFINHRDVHIFPGDSILVFTEWSLL